MESVVLVIHLILALAIIVLVLLQRSEGGGLGIGGGGGGLGNFASARGTANALTKMTALCALGFFITSLTLAVLAGGHSRETRGLLEDIQAEDIQAPVATGDTNPSAQIQFTPPVTDGVTLVPPQNIEKTIKDVKTTIETEVVPETATSSDIKNKLQEAIPQDNIKLPEDKPSAPVE